MSISTKDRRSETPPITLTNIVSCSSKKNLSNIRINANHSELRNIDSDGFSIDQVKVDLEIQKKNVWNLIKHGTNANHVEAYIFDFMDKNQNLSKIIHDIKVQLEFLSENTSLSFQCKVFEEIYILHSVLSDIDFELDFSSRKDLQRYATDLEFHSRRLPKQLEDFSKVVDLYNDLHRNGAEISKYEYPDE